MNTEKLRVLIEALKEAGTVGNPFELAIDGWGKDTRCPAHNAAVDQAAQAALAELDAQAARFDRLLAAVKARKTCRCGMPGGPEVAPGTCCPHYAELETAIAEAEKGT